MGLPIKWIIALCVAYTLATVQLIACYRFKKIQWLLIIKKRYPKLVWMENIVVFIWLIMGLPILSNLYLADNEYVIFSEYIMVPLVLSSHFVLDVEAARLWLISYDLHYLRSLQNEQWKSHIDASFAQKDWYLKNKKTYGH